MNTVFYGYHGSYLYGTNTESSDVDYKGIFIPEVKDMICGNVKDILSYSTGEEHAKNKKGDIDVEMISLRKFINLAIQGETYIMDMLHTPDDKTIITSDVWKYIQRHRDMFYCTNMKAYLGYVMKQASKYGVKGSRVAALRQVVEYMETVSDSKVEQLGENVRGLSVQQLRVKDIANGLPRNEFCFFETDERSNHTFYVLMGRKYMQTITVKEFRAAVNKLWKEYGDRARAAEMNQGIDWKALSHAYRGGVQLKEIYKTGDLVYPLADREMIVKIKQGRLPFKEVQQLLEDTVHEVELLVENAKRNGMRSSPSHEFWQNFVNQVYMDEAHRYFS